VDGFPLETQHYPDSPNHQCDPDRRRQYSAPGQSYDSMTIYKFSIGPNQAPPRPAPALSGAGQTGIRLAGERDSPGAVAA
jgi:hypothetical protein